MVSVSSDNGILGYLLDVFGRRRGYALSCFTLVVLGAALVTFTTRPVYRAKAVVQIEQPSGFVLRTDIFGAGFTRTLPQEQVEILDTYPYKALVDAVTIIATKERLPLARYRDAEAVRHLFENVLCQNSGNQYVENCILTRAAHMEQRSPDEPKDERDFEQEVYGRLIEDTGLIELYAEALSPEHAQTAANAAALVMAWQNEQLRKEEARNTVRFIKDQLDAPSGVREQLVLADRRLAAFKENRRFWDASEQTRALMQQMVELSNRQRLGEVRLSDLRQRLAATRKQLGNEPSTVISPTIFENPTVQEIKKQLVTAEAELLALQAQFTDDHPRVQSALARVHALRQRLQDEAMRIESVQRLPNPIYQELYKNVALLSADILGQEAQQVALQQNIADIQDQLLAVPELERQLTELLRHRQALEKRYLFLMERLQEAELTQAVKLGNTRVVELAQLPGMRVKPRRILNMLAGVVLGVILAISLALLMDQLDRSIPSPQHALRWLNTPLLAAVPSARDAEHISNPLLIEAFRNLRTAIRFASLTQPVRTLLVTSPSAQEGKSFVARHLSVSTAQSGMRVVLVDADLRKPTQHRLDGGTASPGLTNLLLADHELSECLRQTSVSNLWLLPAGITPPNPTELLESARMQEVLARLRDDFDMVVIDVPPVGLFADARVMALYSDATVLVVQPGLTSRDAAQGAVELLRSQPNARLLGIVANKVRTPSDNYSHYYSSRGRQGT